jgi:DNA invertase Pin-like site-specific DNA recombinase
MQTGYLCSSASVDSLRDELDAFERVGCDRIVVDNAPSPDYRLGTLGALIARLERGDTLIVSSLSDVANSMDELIELVSTLDERKIRFWSLAEGLDTDGEQGQSLRTIIGHLEKFRDLVRLRKDTQENASRRVGRPRALTAKAADEARQLLREGVTIDDVAQKFHVSRATLYRYL